MGRPPRITRDQILDAAREAFTARGFAGTTLADVAERLGVTAAAILRHFRTKQELFAAAMSSRSVDIPPYIAELGRVDPASDPRIVLRNFAEQLVPFMQSVIGTAIAVQMHLRATQTTVVVPFDTASEETPPRRGIRILTEYFRRAMDAGVVRRANPRATALLFVGQLQSYVFIHQVLNVTPVYPLDEYLDALIDLWVSGAFVQPKKRGGSRGRNEAEHPQETPSGAGHTRRGRGDAPVHAPAEPAEAGGPRRNARSADGQRRLARRGPRRSRPR